MCVWHANKIAYSTYSETVLHNIYTGFHVASFGLQSSNYHTYILTRTIHSNLFLLLGLKFNSFTLHVMKLIDKNYKIQAYKIVRCVVYVKIIVGWKVCVKLTKLIKSTGSLYKKNAHIYHVLPMHCRIFGFMQFLPYVSESIELNKTQHG